MISYSTPSIHRQTLLVAASFLVAGSLHAIDPEKGPGLPLELENSSPKVRETQRLAHEDMGQVTSIVVSEDGKHAYAAAFGSDTLSILDRNPRSGNLEFRKSLTAPHWSNLVAFRLSPDGALGAGSAFGSDNLILFGRDQDSGEMKELDHANAKEAMPELGFCIDNVFSPDSRFVYAVGSRAIVAFEIVDLKLVHIGTYTDPDPDAVAAVMSGARGVAVSPDGKWLYSSWNSSGSLLVHRRDLKSGELTHVQTLTGNGAGGKKGLVSVMHCTTSPDGKYVYTASGRFGGVDAVCCFKVGARGALHLQQELLGDDLPKGFGGGNEIVVSPNGRVVAVACTTADQLARFTRDPLTGRLKAIDSVQCGVLAKPGAAGLTFDSTGTDILVADENANSIVVFRNIRW